LDLLADRSRRLVHADPDQRNLVLSCGAVLHHLQVVAAGLGWRADVDRSPEAGEPWKLASIVLTPTQVSLSAAQRLHAVTVRQTDRRQLTSEPVTREQLSSLTRTAAGWGAAVIAVKDVDTIAELLRLDARADEISLPTDCEFAPVEVGGVACERLTPVTARPGRTLLYLHGGGDHVGSPRSHRYLAARLADAAGCEAAVPDYRKAPEHPYPGAVEDAVAVYRALSGAVVVAGDSAGAGLAVVLAVAARDQGLPRPCGLMLFSPWADLAHEGTTYGAEPRDTISLTGVRTMAAQYANGANLRDPMISPLHADLSGLPPMLIQVGTDEMLLSDSTRLAERAALAGTEVTLHVIPHLVHGFPVHFPRLASVRRALAEAGLWIGERLGSVEKTA
jgi:acetyl esterase/lipase